jgi:hypothetical protein
MVRWPLRAIQIARAVPYDPAPNTVTDEVSATMFT